MTTELLNKIIKYMMDRPYREVYELMDEVRAEVDRMNKQTKEKVDNEPLNEEVVDGN